MTPKLHGKLKSLGPILQLLWEKAYTPQSLGKKAKSDPHKLDRGVFGFWARRRGTKQTSLGHNVENASRK